MSPAQKQTTMTLYQLMSKGTFTNGQVDLVNNLLTDMGIGDYNSYEHEVDVHNVITDLKSYANKLWEHRTEIPTCQLESQIIPQMSLIDDLLGMIKKAEDEETQQRTNLLQTFASYINKFNQ